MVTRAARQPLDVARLLAPKYPAQPIMSYIPALAWSGSLRLAQMTGEDQVPRQASRDMAPFLSGKTPAIAEPYLLTSLAGHLAFAISRRSTATRTRERWRGRPPTSSCRSPGEIVRFPRKWTDDMFMATSVLARVSALTTDERYAARRGAC